MRQVLAVVLSVVTLAPSITLAASDDVSINRRLILSGKEAETVITPQSAKDEKWLGMNPALTISLFTAGIGAAVGASMPPNKDSEGNELPLTGNDRARRALYGAAGTTAVFGLAALAHCR